MVIVYMSGGLGNQLFQFAFGRALENSRRLEVYFDITEIQQDLKRELKMNEFKTKLRIVKGYYYSSINFPGIKIISKLSFLLFNRPIIWNEIIEEKNQLIQFKNLPDFSVVKGYWQSQEYFNSIKSVISKELHLTNRTFSNEYLIWKQKITSKHSTGIHIRKGDYDTDSTTRLIHGILPIGYFIDCLKEMKLKIPDTVVYLFSEEPEKCNEVLDMFPDINIIPTVLSDIESFDLLRLCKCQIISNSSFSWWSAWLNDSDDKQIYCPEPWTEDAKFHSAHRIPKDWIKRNVSYEI